MRSLTRSVRLLAACAHQQQFLAAAVQEAVAQPVSSSSTLHSQVAACAASQPVLILLHRTLAVSAAARQATHDLPEKGDSYYWLPPAEEQEPFTFDRRGIHERRATGKLETALESVLLADGYLREHLVERYGFSVHRVRFSKDRRTAYILWDASPGKAQACQRALDKNAFRLRGDLARNLKSKHTPYLEFRHDHLPPMQAATAAAIDAAEQELAAAATAAAAADSRESAAAGDDTVQLAVFDAAEQELMQAEETGAGGSSHAGSPVDEAAASLADAQGSGGSFDQQDIDAAIARLEAAVVARRRRPGP